MDWWTDFTVWLDKPSRTGPMESAKDASIGIGVIVMGGVLSENSIRPELA